MATRTDKKPSDDTGGGKETPDSAALVQQVIDDRLFAIHFQPIVDLRSRKVFANEALCRPDRDYFHSPVELIKAAVETEKIGELGLMLRDYAVRYCADSALFLNLNPHEFDEPWLVRPDDPIFKHRHPIYLEITENVPLKFFNQCHSVLAELRKKGNFLAIDDFGAGFSNLKYIAELQPDIVKLDRELVRDCRIGTSEADLLVLITRLCHEMNARVVAEGIEEPEELAAVIAAGVDFGQGYLFAKPAAVPPEIIWPVVPLDPSMVPPEHQKPDFSPSSRVATGEIDLTGGRQSAEASQREEHLQDEIKKLTDLLVQSEVARLGLVRRLKETSEVEPVPADPPTPAPAAAASNSKTTDQPLGKEQENPPSSADDERWFPGEPPRLEPGGSFSVSSKEPRIPGFLWVVPAIIVALLIAWFFWPHGEDPPPLAAVGAPEITAPAALADPETAGPQSPPAASGTPPASIAAAVADELPSEDNAALGEPVQETTEAPEQTQVASPSVQIEPTPAAAPGTGPQAVISQRIEDWAGSWSAQRPSDYLTFYSVTFQTPGGESFSDWADLRRQRISRPDWIEVDLSALEVILTGDNRAIATFEQAYSAPGYSDRVRKTQVWIFEYGNWHILAESSEPI